MILLRLKRKGRIVMLIPTGGFPCSASACASPDWNRCVLRSLMLNMRLSAVYSYCAAPTSMQHINHVAAVLTYALCSWLLCSAIPQRLCSGIHCIAWFIRYALVFTVLLFEPLFIERWSLLAPETSFIDRLLKISWMVRIPRRRSSLVSSRSRRWYESPDGIHRSSLQDFVDDTNPPTAFFRMILSLAFRRFRRWYEFSAVPKTAYIARLLLLP